MNKIENPCECGDMNADACNCKEKKK